MYKISTQIPFHFILLLLLHPYFAAASKECFKESRYSNPISFFTSPPHQIGSRVRLTNTSTEVVFPDLSLICPNILLNGSSYSHDHTHHRFIPFICQIWYTTSCKNFVKQCVISRQNSQIWQKYGKISLCAKNYTTVGCHGCD